MLHVPAATMKRKLNIDNVPEAIESPDRDRKKSSSTTFANLNLDARLLQAVDRSSFVAPTSVQAKAIPLVLDGGDILGESHCFWSYVARANVCSTSQIGRAHV